MGLSALGGSAPAARAQDQIQFDLSVSGLSLGRASVAIDEAGGRYALAGVLHPSRLVTLFADISFNGKAWGRLEQGRLVPERYEAVSTTDERHSEVSLRFRANGRPEVISYQPARDARPYDINPSTLRGMSDPLSVAYMIFSDRSKEALCAESHALFDGRRRSEIVLKAPQISATGARCAGYYQRLEGFAPELMAKARRFNFTLYYEAQEGGLYRLTRFEADTTIGSGTGRRR